MKHYIIERKESWHRPLVATVNDREYEISRMHLHSGKEILKTTYRGWFEHVPHPERDYVTTQDILAIDLSVVRLARKEDLSKEDHFILKYSDSKGGYHQEGYALYMYVPEIHTEQTITKQGESEIGHYTYGLVYLPFIVQASRLKAEGEGIEYYAEERDSIRIQTDYRAEKTAYGERVNRLAEVMNQALGRTNELSTYQIEKLLTAVEITEK